MYLKKKMMSNFYLYLWLRWAFRISVCSVGIASFVSAIITFTLYYLSSTTSVDAKVFSALLDVFWFWFPLVWSLSILLVLFRSIKYIFNICIKGYELKLLTCTSKEVVEVIGYGDLVKVWRRWFMLLIWLVASMMIISLILTYIFSSYISIFEWFNIFWLYAYVVVSGYFSFILMIAKCKRVEIIKC